jgi:hypothetical protein
MASSQEMEGESTSLVLWFLLWAATVQHAGLTLWAMLSTAQLPPEYQISTGWTAFFGKGPSSETYWTYVIVLGINIIWESRFKGSKTYLRSSFPLPDFLYSGIALLLWLVLWAFAHLGQSNGWFPLPDQVGHTLATCALLWLFQKGYVEKHRNPEEETTKDEPQPAQTAPLSVQVTGRPTASPSVIQSKPVPKRRLSKNNESTQKLLDYVRQNGQAKTGALMEALDSPRRTVIRNLNKLLDEGRLVREGSGPGAVYRLKDSPKAEEQN